MAEPKVHTCQCSVCRQEVDHPDKEIHRQMNLLFGCLNHQQRRLYAAIEANRLGIEGRNIVAQIFGISRQTIANGNKELASPFTMPSTQPMRRRKGGGRSLCEVKDPTLKAAMEKLLAYEVAADPSKEYKWVRCSAAHLRDQLKELGYILHQSTVLGLLKRMGYSMRTNIRRRQGYAGNPEKRDKQFAYIATQRQTFGEKGLPIISVDTKKKG